MAFDAFLKLDGIAGESTDKSHAGEIEIESFSWGVSNATSGGGSGAGQGKASFEDLHFTMTQTKASPALLAACAGGKHIPTGQLTLRKGGGGPNSVEFLKIKLQDVLVSSYQTGGNLLDGGYSLLGGNADMPTDQVTLNFVKMDFLYTAPRTGETAEAITGANVGDVTGAAG